ncbi:unnamed protein product [Schistosoma margrebowiei]|uniref:Uncharacterized protein n=1 Tax=Schistosoma margrebowiei TaxID=48269 RepID=A0A183N0G1_9TREM|nr:unnamed protein product [Schistosoma margrebowiei]
MNSILSDHTRFKFEKSNKDLTDSTEKRITKVLRDLLKKKMIDNSTYNNLRPRESRLPHMYGLPKIHKQDSPLKPLMSMVNSPYHKIARWLADKLEPLRQRLATYTLKDSFVFADSMNHINIAGKFMNSFDVTSLFTKIPLLETKDIICQHPYILRLPAIEFKRLLFLCTKDFQFQFNNTIYRQTDGVAMGSPLGPVLADIFMANLERTKLKGAIDEMMYYSRVKRMEDHQYTVWQWHLKMKLSTVIETEIEHSRSVRVFWSETMASAVRKKLVIVGDGACGKTCLLIVFSKDQFPEVYVPTVFENYVADIEVDNRQVGVYVLIICGRLN